MAKPDELAFLPGNQRIEITVGYIAQCTRFVPRVICSNIINISDFSTTSKKKAIVFNVKERVVCNVVDVVRNTTDLCQPTHTFQRLL
jgi:hypothetical protein